LRPATTRLGWQVDVDTFIQVDAVPWSSGSQDQISPATSAPLNEETVTLRRAFLRVEGKRDDFHAGLEFDGNTLAGPAARLLGASVGWSPDERIALDAGLMLVPFGAATPLNARYRYFMEQPTYLRAFFPGEYDAGAIAKGAYELVRWSLAATNGAPTKDAQWQGKDPASSFDLIARIGTDISIPTIPGRPHFAAGLSALAGESLHPGTPPTKDQLVWVDENMDGIVQPTELQVIPGSAGEPSQTFKHRAVGVDARADWCLRGAGHGEAVFEGAIATNLDRGVYYADPVATSRNIRELGWMLGVVQRIGSHALAGIRYDTYDADRDASQRLGINLVGTHKVFSTWAFLAAAQQGTTRLSLEYDRVRNPLGRSDSGMPATRADDRIVLRAQAEF
jgi:hypothetical protein